LKDWLELERRFRDLSEHLQAARIDHQTGAAGESWDFSGARNNLRASEFRALAAVAGRFLERSQGAANNEALSRCLGERDPTIRWYRLLESSGGTSENKGMGQLTDPTTGDPKGAVFFGSIYTPAEASATLCLLLHANHPVHDTRPFHRRIYEDHFEKIVVAVLIAVVGTLITTVFALLF
jgi:hypothetical protein